MRLRRFRSRDLREEMEFHREQVGQRAFGNELLWRERSRDEWGWQWLESLGRHARLAGRQMRRAPGFTAAVVLTLALGIGAVTAVFAVANAALLRALPVPRPDQLTLLYWSTPHAPQDLGTSGTNEGLPSANGTMHGHSTGGSENYSIAYPDFVALAAPARRVASALFGWASLDDGYSTLVVDGDAARARASLVSAEYFSGLDVAAARGRMLLPTDFSAGAPLVAVISDAYWAARFGRSPQALGTSIAIDRHPAVIVGIAPPGFQGLEQGLPDDLWLPLAPNNGLLPWGFMPQHGTPFTATDYWWLQVMARRRPGVSPAQLQAALASTFNPAAVDDVRAMLQPGDGAPQLHVIAGSHGINDLFGYGATIELLLAGVGLLLLLACVNVAALLLARSGARRREIGVRMALGAGRAKLIGMLLTESVILAGAGGAIGLALAPDAARLLGTWLLGASGLPARPLLDWRVAGFAVAASVLSGIAFGLAPAVRSTRFDLSRTINRSPEASRGYRLWSDKGLAMAQTALSLLLVAGAGLLVRTWVHLANQPLGFDPGHVLTFSLDARTAGHPPATLAPFFLEAQRQLAALPGVLGATTSQHSTLGGDLGGDGVLIPASNTPTKEQDVLRNGVGPDFFSTMRMAILRGRAINEQDVRGARPVCVINESMARKLFGRTDPLGQLVNRIDTATSSTPFTVVGIAADARYSNLTSPVGPTYYIPFTRLQSPTGSVMVALRTAGPPTAVLPEVRRLIRRLDPNLPVSQPESQAERDLTTVGSERLMARMGGFFALVGLLLAAIGIEGTMAYAVARRTRDIGVRMALGAERGRVLRGILWECLGIAVPGTAAGIILSLALGRLLATQLYGVTAHDPATLAAATLVLITVALLAGWLPARRAAGVDPVIALRQD